MNLSENVLVKLGRFVGPPSSCAQARTASQCHLQKSRIRSAVFLVFLAWLHGSVTLHAGSGKAAAESPDDDAADATWEIGLKSAIGWQSNLFEVNNRLEKPKGDGFSESSLDLAYSPDGEDGDLTATFNGSWKKYFHVNQVDEYLLKPGVKWRAFDEDDTNLVFEAYGSRFRERIHNESVNLSDRAEPGWGGGVGWKLESELAKKTTFTWDGAVDFQWFDHVPQDNVKFSTGAEFEHEWADDAKWTAGMKWEYQSYRVRPQDTAPSGNPPRLETLEGRLSAGIDIKIGSGWNLEMQVLGGPNIDLTNGYYDAGMLGVITELSWKTEHWKFKASVEPEWIWYGRRPANLSAPERKLVQQEYLVELGIEYALTKKLSIFAGAGLHLQVTNARQAAADVTLNNFADRSARAGVTFTF